MDRLTKWEGINADGTPRAVLVKRDGNWNDNIQEALRKLADYEDILEAEEAAGLALFESGVVSVKDMHDRAEAERQKSLLMDHDPNYVECKAFNLYEMDERVLAQHVQDIIDYIERSET